MIVLVPILWFMLSFIIANAASQRGRRAIDWFLLSLVTSPVLAALFLLLFPTVPRPGHSYQINDQVLHESIPADERYQASGNGKSIAILWMIFITLVFLGVLIIAKFAKPEHSGDGASTPAEPTSYTRSYETVAQMTCMDLLNVLDTSRSSEMIDPVVEIIGQHDEFGTPVNRTSYLLTECRLREGQTIAKAVDNLFEQKRTGHLPQIPIGGATSDAYVRAIWIPFDKWVRHQGPRPNFSKAGGF
jgi:hypothetical protein